MPIGDADRLKALMTGKGGGGLPIVRLTEEENTLLVRFLTEPTEWEEFKSWFDSSTNRSMLIAEGERAPRGEKPRQKYLANILDVDSDAVLALEMPQTLAQQIYTRWSKSRAGTILDRDFELIRTGSGKNNTKYNASPEAPLKRNLKKYELLDLEDILFAMHGNDDAPDEDEEDEPVRPAKRATKRVAKQVRPVAAKPTLPKSRVGKPAAAKTARPVARKAAPEAPAPSRRPARRR